MNKEQPDLSAVSTKELLLELKRRSVTSARETLAKFEALQKRRSNAS